MTEELKEIIEKIREKLEMGYRLTHLDLFCIDSYLTKNNWKWDICYANKGWWIRPGHIRGGDPKEYEYATITTLELYA